MRNFNLIGWRDQYSDFARAKENIMHRKCDKSQLEEVPLKEVVLPDCDVVTNLPSLREVLVQSV